MSALDVLNDAHRAGNMRDTKEAMKTEDGSVADMVAALSTQENFDKATCVVRILNAFNLSKLKLTGTCEWTIHDLRAFAFAVRALGTSWEIEAQAQEAIDKRGQRRQEARPQ